MSAALVVPIELNVGQNLTVTGTGYDNSEPIDVKITNPDESADVTFIVGSSGGGAIDLSTVGKFVPQKAGVYTVSTVDPDGGGVVVAECQVFAP